MEGRRQGGEGGRGGGWRSAGGGSGKWRHARCTHSAEPSIIDIISPGWAALVARISGDVSKKAQKLDERLPPTLRGDGEKGPVERRLDELGTVFGIAFGSFGELSPGLEKLLAEAAKKGGPRVCSDFLVPEGKPAECAAKQRLTRRWGMMAWRVRAAIIEDRMWALGGSRSPKRARHANWERAQCRQSEHFCGRGRGASSAGRSDYYQF